MIEVKRLVKKFGNFTAVDDISFTVKQGEVLGFLGPNGAGKSTTMKVVTCFIPPTSGTVVVGGKDILTDPIGVREQIGYLPESAPSYAEMTVIEFLRFIADVRGIRGAAQKQRIGEIIELTALEGVHHQIIETLSKGYRQRVCFAQALLPDPPMLIMDEPTDGLDPNQKHEMRELIRRMAERKTVVLSTHILEEMEAVCNRAIIIARGRIVFDGTPDGMAAMSKFHNAVTIRTRAAQPEGLLRQLEGLKGVAEASYTRGQGNAPGTFIVFARNGQPILAEVTEFLERHKVATEEVFASRGHVDEVFRRLTTETAAA